MFYVFLCFSGFLVLSRWVYLSSRPWFRVAWDFSSLLFSILSCVLCVFVFFPYFWFQCHCSCFVCFCVFVFNWRIHLASSTVSVFFVFLCFFPRQGFFPQNLSVMGGCTHSVLKGGMSDFFFDFAKTNEPILSCWPKLAPKCRLLAIGSPSRLADNFPPDNCPPDKFPLGGTCPKGNLSGGTCPGGSCPGGSCPF